MDTAVASVTPVSPVWGHLARRALAVLLLALVYVCGQPALDAPWIQGDEHRFIVNNPDVTGAGRAEPRLVRWAGIFTHYHDDLYQPIPVLTYAIEWDLWGEQRVFFMRQTDVILHALNALLLWGVLRKLLQVFGRVGESPAIMVLTWALALLWALHPIQVSAYAADMGRTHLLSAGLALLSLRCQIAAFERRRPAWTAGALVLLTLAMMAKPVVGWVALVFLLAWHYRGWRAAWLSPAVWLTGVLGVIFAAVTLLATRQADMLTEFDELLFGDRVSRSLHATWLYATNLLWPAWLSTWYPPDPRSVWSHPTVWTGLLVVLISLAALVWSLRQPGRRGYTFGLTWFWVLLLPVIGVIGARVAAGNDRYVYQPLMGLLLIVGLLAVRWARRPFAAAPLPRRLHMASVVLIVLALAAVPLNRHLCATARSTIARAERTVSLYPAHPRATEVLAVSAEFAATHDTVERRVHGQAALMQQARAALDRAVALADEHPRFFTSPADRAALHRRLSHRYLLHDVADAALEQALRAHALEPESHASWTTLAQALRRAGRFAEAGAAYAEAEAHLPDDHRFLAQRCTEHADLLLHRLAAPTEAIPRYRRALADPRIDDETRRVATLGLALAEIRGGLGATGHELLQQILAEVPDSVPALLALGEYHLRSHHWPAAEHAFLSVLVQQPLHRQALRSLHEALVQQGRDSDATLLWLSAYERAPADRMIRGFLAWSAASEGHADAAATAESILAVDPGNPLVNYALALLALRAGDVPQAAARCHAAADGEPLPEEPADRRAALAFTRLVEAGQLPHDTHVVIALIWARGNDRARAAAALAAYRAAPGGAAADALAADVATRLAEAPE
jgi:tetratricopeptide (TPR) repeat protein